MMRIAMLVALILATALGTTAQAQGDATITGVTVTFITHNDNKDNDTAVSFILQNKVSMTLTKDIGKLNNFANNSEFGDNPPSQHSYDLELASDNIRVSELNVPVFTVEIAPNGHDRWIFDCKITIAASDGSRYTSTTRGIVLDQDNRTYKGSFSAD